MSDPENTAPKPDSDPSASESDASEQNSASEAEATTEQPISIRLDQFLQLCGVPTGGQAKLLIQGGEVTVNGELETRRRRKLVPGDSVGCDGQIFDVGTEE